MIVKCEQCQTRFKIPDEKVSERGVKVRCTKCGHTFRVTREPEPPATPDFVVPPETQPPPPSMDPFARFGAGGELAEAQATRPGHFALGVEATRSPSLGANPFAGPPSAAPAAQGFDFSSLAPPRTVPSMPAVEEAPPPFPFSVGADPMPPVSSPFSLSSPPSPPAPPKESVSPFGVVAAASQTDSAYSPFGFSGQSQGPATSTPSGTFGFGFSSPPSPMPEVPSPALDGLKTEAPLGSPSGTFDYGPPSTAPTSPFDDGPVTQRSTVSSALSQDSRAPALAGIFGDDTAQAVSAEQGAAARAMFDLPPSAPSTSTLPDVPEPEVAPSMAPAPSARGNSASALPQVNTPRAESPSRPRSMLGLAVNLVVAGVLVALLFVVVSAFLNEGTVRRDALSIESLKNTFAPSVEFVASDVSNGLYETRAGRSIFFVRGEVTNRSHAAVKLVVKAELVEDGSVVRFAESWAGEPATPEELFHLDTIEAVESLERRVEKRAIVVSPDATVSFVIPFREYPPDLKEFRVRVSARAVTASPSPANR